MNDWHKVHITDKTGAEFFVCSASPMSTQSEIKNLKRHIEQAKKNPAAYGFLDANTAVLMLDGTPYEAPQDFDADALLAELGL